MLNSLRLISGKRKYLLGLLLLSGSSIIYLAFSMKRADSFDIARREVLLRQIGHEILLQSGDSVSRILPVKKIGAQEYRISFEHAFAFQPDLLVNATRRLLARDPLSGDYVVNIRNSGNSSVAYGFAISSDKKDDIIACKGRVQPAAHYVIDIKFKPTEINTVQKVSLLSSLPALALVGFLFLRSFKQRKTLPEAQENSTFTLGSVLFDAAHRKLIVNGNAIDLTGTEARIFLIFALRPNEIIERSRLQKEIWEDEGVIVGRSLDMFISKLRKKLEPEPHVRITVIRGRGYKLEISA